MKKFGILCLALVMALGALGVGYAAWTDTIFIDGTISTGSVCLEFEVDQWAEVNNCPDSINNPSEEADMNWDGWVQQAGGISCPMGYKFVDKPCSDKDVAYMTFNPVLDADDNVVELEVTIHNAYPHYLGRVTFEVCNCGTVPVKIKAPDFVQSPFLLIEYRNGVGEQIEPGGCHEVSLYIGVVQHEGYKSATSSLWVVDDPAMPLLPQNAGAGGANPPALTFTVEIEAIQWDEY